MSLDEDKQLADQHRARVARLEQLVDGMLEAAADDDDDDDAMDGLVMGALLRVDDAFDRELVERELQRAPIEDDWHDKLGRRRVFVDDGQSRQLFLVPRCRRCGHDLCPCCEVSCDTVDCVCSQHDPPRCEVDAPVEACGYVHRCLEPIDLIEALDWETERTFEAMGGLPLALWKRVQALEHVSSGYRDALGRALEIVVDEEP